MSATGDLAGARLKVERAKQHVADLERVLRAFHDTGPYKVGAKRDSQTRQLVYYLTSVEPTPVEIPVIAGEAIHAVRSALEHLAYQLVWVGTGTPPASNVYFPIADDATKYAAKVLRDVKGADPVAVKAIDAIEPYKGGKGHELWVLNKLNNIDKHHLLLTVGSAYRSLNIGPHLEQMFAGLLAKSVNIGPLPAMPDVFIRPADRMCPLKVGDHLFTDAPDAEVNEKIQFTFEIALNEPQIA